MERERSPAMGIDTVKRKYDMNSIAFNGYRQGRVKLMFQLVIK